MDGKLRCMTDSGASEDVVFLLSTRAIQAGISKESGLRNKVQLLFDVWYICSKP